MNSLGFALFLLMEIGVIWFTVWAASKIFPVWKYHKTHEKEGVINIAQAIGVILIINTAALLHFAGATSVDVILAALGFVLAGVLTIVHQVRRYKKPAKYSRGMIILLAIGIVATGAIPLYPR